MKLRTRFMVTFVTVILSAVILTDLTYRVVYTTENNALLRYSSSSPEAASRVQLLMVLVVPFLWMTLCLSVGAWWLGRRFSSPLRQLTEAADHLKHRDLDFRIQYAGNDEVGAVCRAFTDMQGALKASLDREWREQENRREMVAAIAHDLRTPLTVVRSHADSLLEAPEQRRAERIDRYLRTIASNAERAAALLDDLLTLSNYERAEFAMHTQPAALQAVIADWFPEFDLLARGCSLQLLWDPDPTPGAYAETVNVDLPRLRQVLDNLMANALRHTPPDGTIGLRVRVIDSTMRVELWDTGRGFAAADLPHLFDRYFQGGAGAVGGAGLGLYICRLLVERHGGWIHATNRSGGGGSVTFHLPLA